MKVDAQLLEHLMEPKNYGALESAKLHGIGKNPLNGEKVIVHIKVGEDEEQPYVKDIRFQAVGCNTTIVAGSMLTEEARDLNFNGVRNLVSATMELLSKLPEEDAACSEMVALALLAAIDTYEKRKDDPEHPIMTYNVSGTCVPKEEIS
ncbi:MAG: iron-sulfur cluster assembly scaffold protein [Sulfurovum sp.]|nr:MAG: iron-sulfur cluster assembly scaffold protein [Sulfurovum sp.]